MTVGTLAYDGFGAATTNTGSTDRYQYTAREFDSALGLMYSRARMYDPVSGRFLGLDQSSFSAGDPNLYRYVGNSPTNGTDPSGLDYLYEDGGHAYIATQIKAWYYGGDKTVGHVHIGRIVEGGDGIKRIFPADAPKWGKDFQWKGMVEYRALENKQKGIVTVHRVNA